MKKKNTQTSNRDYLKIVSIAIAVITLSITVFAWWNSYDLLNTLGFVFVIIGVSLIPVTIFLLFIFWLRMLMDSAREKRWIWFVAILLGDILFAGIYLLIKKPRLDWRFFRPFAWVSLGLYVYMWSFQIYPGLTNRIDPVDLSKLEPTGREFVTKVETKDLKGYRYEGKTVCREMKLDDNKYYLKVTGGTVSASSDQQLELNYRLSASSDIQTKISSGWQHVEESQPTKTQKIEVAELVGGPAQINSGLTGCELELWSSN